MGNTIRISYEKKQQRFILIYGLATFMLGIITLLTRPESSTAPVATVTGFCFLAFFFVRHYGRYGYIDQHQIVKGSLIKTAIAQDEITDVKMFADEIEIYSAKRKIVFDKSKIDKSQLPEVEEYFRRKILD
jgi:hypothetical protein